MGLSYSTADGAPASRVVTTGLGAFVGTGLLSSNLDTREHLFPDNPAVLAHSTGLQDGPRSRVTQKP